MGILSQGILGPVKGKIGAVVGSNWKGINTVRGYTIPTDPQTEDQVTQRTMFAWIVLIAKLLLSDVIHTYWEQFAVKMSGYNKFVQSNRNAVSAVDTYSELVISEGSLEPSPLTAANYSDSSGYLGLEWSGSLLGNGLGTDKVVCICIDANNEVAFFDDSTTRSDTSCDIDIGAGRTPSDLHAYMFFTRGLAETLEVSASDYMVVSAT